MGAERVGWEVIGIGDGGEGWGMQKDEKRGKILDFFGVLCIMGGRLHEEGPSKDGPPTEQEPTVVSRCFPQCGDAPPGQGRLV